jgi:hypothetical protein
MKKVKKYFRLFLLILSSLIILFLLFIVFVFRPWSFGESPKIPQGWGHKHVKLFKGSRAYPKPINVPVNACNPFLVNSNSQTMHADCYASGVHKFGGPLGINPRVISYAHGNFGGECACVTFDSRGNIVAVFGSLKEFALLLISPGDLKVLASISLPGRKSSRTLNIRKIVNDTSGGAYFFLDNEDRAVLIDGDQVFKIIAQIWKGNNVHFEIVKKYSLLDILLKHTGSDDAITSVLPDWEGRYWFVSRHGIVGVLNPANNGISVLRLENEEIQNSFAIDSNAAYIVSDCALYGISTIEGSDAPFIVWREAYEKSTKRKKGSITLGSGTTPTLLGNKYVAIADNADPQVHVLVYRREIDFSGKRLICKVPVFEAGKSVTENSLIGVNYSLIIENNFGYDLFTNMIFGRAGAGGVARIDFSEATGDAEIIWHNPVVSQTTVPKLSLENGLIYVYSKDPTIGRGIDAYYLSALDFETGETRFEILTGTGISYDNNWAPVTLGPDRSAYIGVLRGLVKVFDGDNL